MKSIWINKSEYKAIPGDDRFVSCNGTIVSLRRGNIKILSLAKDKDGYLKASRPEIKAHVAVLLAWRGVKPINAQCRHLDGDVSNNHISNLKWGTSKENGKDKSGHGTEKGEKNPASKMNECLVLKLREDYKAKPLSVLVKENNKFSKFAIWAAVSGYTWSHLPNSSPRKRTCYRGLK